MKKMSAFCIFMMVLLVLSACDYSTAKPVFDIFGSPNPLYYGGSCPKPVLHLVVSGPGEGLRINSIIAAYQLFDGSGKKIHQDAYNLNPVPDTPAFTYDADRMINVPDSGGSASSPDSPVIADFGAGHVDFAATVYAKFLSPPASGSSETYYFTSTKSIPVLPCTSRTPTPGVPSISVTIASGSRPGLDLATVKAPGSDVKPPAPPPSCSVDPNNPSCVP
jgi:hypothetical protein